MKLPYRLVGSFKGMMFVLTVVVILGVMIYTDRVVSDLREASRRYLSVKVERFKMLLTSGSDADLEQYLSEMAVKDFPMIVTDSLGNPNSWSGLPELDVLPFEQAVARARDYQKEWLRQGNRPVALDIPEHGLKFYYYYGDSDQIRKLRIMPWVEVVVVGGLVLVGYLGFAHIKRSEESSVWVGMARETAHQLGTPLTSLCGWVELLRDNPADRAVLEEVSRDVQRLRTIAERFHRIGSRAPLTQVPLKPVVDDALGYIRKRLPETTSGAVRLEAEVPDQLSVRIDPTLMTWVFENLLKNGVEALRSKPGTVSVRAEERNRRVVVDVSDTGCGIPRREWRNVFRPGYTTKERGWGLGLSLARRIIEDVHRGKIVVFTSASDKGTTMRITLKK